MFEKARAITKRRAEIDPDKYNEWLVANGYLAPGQTQPTPINSKEVSDWRETTYLGGQLDPEELRQVVESLTKFE